MTPSSSNEVATTLPPKADNGRGELPQGIDELAAKHRTAKEDVRRGVKPGTVRGNYKKGGVQPGQNREVGGPDSSADAEILTKEALKPIIALPFNFACIKTGYEGWLLSELEEESLARSGSVAFNAWVKIDPRYVALITFSLGLLSITAAKTLMYKKALREKIEADRKAQNADAGQTPS
jgi:hypothetical protein